MNLTALSRLWVEPRTPLHPIALCDGKIIPFSQFSNDVCGVAARLTDCRRAVLACNDSYYFLVGLFALLHVEAVIVLPANAKPSGLNTPSLRYDRVIEDDFIAMSPGQGMHLSTLDPLRSAFEFFTSGSTGKPKTIHKNLRMLENEIQSLDTLLGAELKHGPVFSNVPHQHLYGLIFKLLWPLASGRIFAASTHTFWETLLPELTNDSVIVSSPTHLGRLGGIEPLSPSKYPSHIFSAGAPLPFAARRQSEAVFGCIPTEIFGSTETGAIAMRRQKEVNVPWQALPGVTIECDLESKMIVRSPSMGTEAFSSEDRIELLPNGFHFLGRADRIAKVEGKRISLMEVENALHQLSIVSAAAVLVVSGDSTKLAAAVIPSPEGQALLLQEGKFRFSAKLRQALALTLEPMAIPRLWQFVDALPANDLGKICEAELLPLFKKNI